MAASEKAIPRVLWLCLAAVCVAISPYATSWVTELSDGILTGLVFTGFVGTVAAVRYGETRDVLDPLIVFSGAIAFAFGIHTVWLYLQPADYAPFPTPYQAGVAHSMLLLAAAYVLLVVAFTVTPPRLRVTRRAAERQFSQTALWVVFAMGLAADVYGISVGAFIKAGTNANSASLLQVRTLGDLALVAFTASAVQYYRDRTPSRLATALAQGLVLFGFGLVIGHKASMVNVIFAWLAARHYAYMRLRPRSVALALAVFVFVLSPIIQSGRDPTVLTANLDATTQANTTLATLPTRVQELVRHPAGLLSGFDIINRRTGGVESLALSYADTPSVHDYQYGASFIDIPLSLIPHQLYPSKRPPHDPTVAFSLQYAGVQNNGYSGLAVSPTVPGDLYVNFGLFGVLIGFTLLGLGLRLVSNLVRTTDVAISVPVYAVIMLQVTLVEVSVSRFTSAILINVAVATIALVTMSAVSGRRRPSGGAGEPAHGRFAAGRPKLAADGYVRSRA